MRNVWRMPPVLVGLGVREKAKVWCLLRLLGGGGGSGERCEGEGPREDARDEATMALARWSEVMLEGLVRGGSWLFWAGRDLIDAEEGERFWDMREEGRGGCFCMAIGLAAVLRTGGGDGGACLDAGLAAALLAGEGSGACRCCLCAGLGDMTAVGELGTVGTSDADAKESADESLRGGGLTLFAR